MNCKICDSKIKNNSCVKCELIYKESEIVLMRHCWNFDEYKETTLRNHESQKLKHHN